MDSSTPVADLANTDFIVAVVLITHAVVSEMPEDARERVIARLKMATTTFSEEGYRGADGAQLVLTLTTQVLSATQGMTLDALYDLFHGKPKPAH